jgi:hypothetical protein
VREQITLAARTKSFRCHERHLGVPNCTSASMDARVLVIRQTKDIRL